MMSRRGLVGVELPDLVALLRALEQGRLAPPFADEALLAAGLGHLTEAIGFLRGLDAAAVRAVLTVAIAEREERPSPRLDLVWTGPEAKISPARDTGVVVRELFAEAQKDVLICGFTFDHGEEIFRPLHGAMREHGVETAVFLDVEGSWKRGQEGTTAELDDRVGPDRRPLLRGELDVRRPEAGDLLRPADGAAVQLGEPAREVHRGGPAADAGDVGELHGPGSDAQHRGGRPDRGRRVRDASARAVVGVGVGGAGAPSVPAGRGGCFAASCRRPARFFVPKGRPRLAPGFSPGCSSAWSGARAAR